MEEIPGVVSCSDEYHIAFAIKETSWVGMIMIEGGDHFCLLMFCYPITKMVWGIGRSLYHHNVAMLLEIL